MMDKRVLRSRKGKPRNGRPYDRQNQSIFGKVCSTVKGLFNPSWLFTHWTSNTEDEKPEGSSDDIEDNIGNDNDVVSQSVSHGSKRLRLRFDDQVPLIQSSGTQTWHDQSLQNVYETVSHVESSNTQSSLLENKETITVLNGDDHSENSEGAASTSGCSSLISSHKECSRLSESPFVSLLDIRNSRKRKEPSKSGFNDLNTSRGLWSSSFSPSSNFHRRLPTISHTNQPSFNLSTFGGLSKLNESVEKNISSPFYEGRTTYGGASALRRMPSSVAPYQVDKSLRDQIRGREQNSEDSLEGMSSAAKRILLTLEKMSTPVADAKKIPNSDASPVDLSLYLTPPKSRRNSQFTPSVASKGPPIANISTIAKLATLKNYGSNRLRNTLQDSSVISVEQKSSNLEFLQASTSDTVAQKSGGGKMKNKLNHHHSSKATNADNEVLEVPVLNSVPLPISTLPTINFKRNTEKAVDTQLSAKGFTFSNPIEHDLSISTTVPVSTLTLPSPYNSFKFSNPIEHELPIILPKETKSVMTWECDACWVKNAQSRSSCAACEASRVSKESNPGSTAVDKADTWECSTCWVKNPREVSNCMACETPSTKDTTSSTATTVTGMSTGNWECSSCWVKNPANLSKCIACEAPQSVSNKVSDVKSLVRNAFSTWECTSCWVRNPMKEKKCLACETLHPSADGNSGVKDTNGMKFSSPLQNSPITFKFGNYVCTAPSTVVTSSFKFGVSDSEKQTTTTSSGFKFGASSNINSVFGSVVSSSDNKLSEVPSVMTQSCSTSGFKVPYAIPDNSEKKLDEQVPNSFTSETISQTNDKSRTIIKKLEQSSESSKVNSEGQVTDAEDSFIKAAKSTPEPPKDASEIINPLKMSNNSEGKLSDTVITSSSSTISVSKAKDVPYPSVTACFGFTTQPVQSITKDKNENKLYSVFQSKSESQTTPTPSVNLFKFSEKGSASKINLSTTSVSLTTATTTSFSFSGNVSNFGSVANSKANEITPVVSEIHSTPIRTEENKIPASVSFTSVTTSSSFVFGNAVTTSAPSAFSFFSSSSASTSTPSVFTFGASSSATQVSKAGGFIFKGLEKSQTIPAISSSTSQSAMPVLSVATPAPVPSGGFVFGASKTETPATSVSFAFGSGVTSSSSNTSAFSAFQPSQSPSASFQFSNQPPVSTSSTIGTSTSFVFAKSEAPSLIPSSASQNPVSAFGSTTPSFVFGSKNEASNQIPNTVSQTSGLAFGSSANFTFNNKTDNTNTVSQNSTQVFGSSTMPPVFGTNPVPPSFDGSDKLASGGFNFGASSAGVFQFGASNNTEKKRTATASGFSFGAPTTSETNNSFSQGFNINTPQTFNFGVASSAGPFQFVASTAAKPPPAQNAPRKYRKALRRVTRKD